MVPVLESVHVIIAMIEQLEQVWWKNIDFPAIYVSYCDIMYQLERGDSL
jgi:hypothetical protein